MSYGGGGGFYAPPSGAPPGYGGNRGGYGGDSGYGGNSGGFAPPPGPPPGDGYGASGAGYAGHHGTHYAGGGFAPPSGPPPNMQGGSYGQQGGGYGGDSGSYGGRHGAGGFAPPSGPPPDLQSGGYGQQSGGYGQPNGGYGHHSSGGGFAPPAGPPPGWGDRIEGPIGPSAYQNQEVHTERPTGQTMENGMRYEYSSMTGKRKALLIGINYVGTNAALKGCWNDVDNIKEFIMYKGYKQEDMVILTDRDQNARNKPTRANMTAAMHWLVNGAQAGDALFFHYSGHGGQAEAHDGDEGDGLNETIIPLDYQQAGQMEDDELHNLLVRPLPVGCRLTAIFDSCHSGTVLDLPYVYATSGKIKEPNVLASVGKGVLSAAMDYARGDMASVFKGLFNTAMTAKNTSSAESVTKQTRSSGADVVMLSGCKDSQTSADAVEANKATGACSWAFITVMKKYPRLTYYQLLNSVRDELVNKYSQKPQLSSSHPIDLSLTFIL